MSKLYEKANAQTHKMVLGLLKEHHTAVFDQKLDLIVLLVESTTDADALTLHGHACLAQIRINTPLQVAIHGVNVVILLDADRYAGLSLPKKLALLDHELCHLEVTPKGKLTLRPDDYQINGFQACIERHGKDAIEVMTLANVHAKIGTEGMQHVFDFVSPETIETGVKMVVASLYKKGVTISVPTKKRKTGS